MIYLDMDGVCCQFAESALKLYNKEHLLKNWTPGEYDICKVLGVKPKDFWKRIENAGGSFWSLMPEYSWFNALYGMCLAYSENVYFLTSPARFAHCWAGKYTWITTRFGVEFTNIIFTNHKHLLANSEALLIDDSDSQCRAFSMAGGNAIVFPQPWNTQYPLTEHRIDHIQASFDVFFDGVKTTESDTGDSHVTQ